MEKVEAFPQIAPLLSAQLQKGVVTNTFLSAADYDAEIKNGLWVAASDGQLLLLRERNTHYILNFYLQPGAHLHLPDFAKPVILELPYRTKDAAALLRTAAQFQSLGFTPCLRRTRRTRAAAPAVSSGDVLIAGQSHFAVIAAFLRESFSCFTGCLPTDAALLNALRQREILYLTDSTGVAGLLHFSHLRTGTELRHLAVRTDLRGQGLASQLLSAYLAATGNQKSQVWATTGYLPAERLYETQDYRPDGWNSIVLQYKGEFT